MIRTAILGATGNVGQIFIQLLQNHPWFKTSVLAASEKSAQRKYIDAVKWRQETPIPEEVADMQVVPAEPKAVKDVDLVFSALPADIAKKTEEDFAKAGYIVVSNASAHRMEPDVPLLNPEINFDHISLIEEQRRKRRWDGAIVTNPNCSTSILTIPLKPIYDKFGIKKVIVSTMQAVSGAGYPGVPSLDIIDNIIPFIEKEEEKIETETLKILGSKQKPASFQISASCHRVPTIDGHMEAVFIELEQDSDCETIIEAMQDFTGKPQKLKLPTAPEQPIIIRREADRPQTRLDRMTGKGMSVTVGRVRKDNALKGVKFIALGHNTVRGAAGCGILNAECLKAQGYI